MSERTHLHRDDHPATLALLETLRNDRPAADWALIGYEPTDAGAWVDWDALAGSWLSSTEKAVVHVARGCATLERAGGPAPRLRARLIATIEAVSG